MEMYCSLVKCSNEEIVRTLFDKHGKGAYLFPLIATFIKIEKRVRITNMVQHIH